MDRAFEISKWIENNAHRIIENINQESIDVYKFIKKEFEATNANENLLFQFVYRSFYRIDNAGLTPKFKKEYFAILEELRYEKKYDIETIIKRLYDFPNRKGQNTVQFSFVTKMLNTLNETLPIYDAEVARLFSFTRPYQSELDIKLEKYMRQLQLIKEVYEAIIAKQLLVKTTTQFDKTFIDHKLSITKKLDFIFWSAGKIKKAVSHKKSKIIQSDGMFDDIDEQSVIANYNIVLRLRNSGYCLKDICNHLSISKDELTDLEINYNYITGS